MTLSTDTYSDGNYGKIVAPRTLVIQRHLPGPVERLWDYLTKSDLRRQWLASGDMPMQVGAECELVWHHDQTTTPPGERPEGVNAESHLMSRVTVCEPPRRLGFMFWSDSEVLFELQPTGKSVLLTVTHSKLPSRSMMVGVSTGWHTHLDVLGKRLAGEPAENFWDHYRVNKAEYEKRIPEDA